ncbi:MAG: hypothetical protein H0U95_13875 [Bacteroidetes bacterium]|nr:hypothetical protein [Bacteroidota bacterium]
MDDKNYSKAEEYGKRALTISIEIGNLKVIKSASQKLCTIYRKENRLEEALKMMDRYLEVTNKITSQESEKAALQFDFNKKEEIAKAEQSKRDEIAIKEKQKQSIIILSVSSCLLIVMIFSLLLFNRFRIIQKQKKIIEKQKQLVEDKQKDILDSLNYAKRIQTSLLPTEKYMRKFLPNSIS